MTVIPFDPSRRQRARAGEQSCRAGGRAETGRDVVAHVALLERALVQILRENAQNWARAEAAESRLAAIERQQTR